MKTERQQIMSKINVDHLAKNLPPKPFKFSRTIKAGKTRVGYKNIIPWLCTNGELRADLNDNNLRVFCDDNNVVHTFRSSLHEEEVKSCFAGEAVVSIWSSDNNGFFWEGLFSAKDTSKLIANHYNMAGGGVSMDIRNLKALGGK